MVAVLLIFSSLPPSQPFPYSRTRYFLSAAAVTAGFPNIETITGEFYTYMFSFSGAARTSVLSLPSLASVGSWYFYRNYVTAVSCESLETVGGRFFWRLMYEKSHYTFASRSS